MTTFRFQTGSIKRYRNHIPSGINPTSFDSKLVRLKVRFTVLRTARLRCFDSKLVRLKAETTERSVWCKQSFDSKLVRLKGQIREILNFHEILVSIPNWFD